MSALKNRFSDFFSSRATGFYVTAIAAVLSVVAAILYVSAYSDSKYMSWLAFALSLCAGIVFIGLALFRQTERWAPVVTGVFDFVALLSFIHSGYLYLSEVFYNGEFAGFSFMFLVFILFVVFQIGNIVLCNIGIYAAQGKYEKDTTVEEAKA